MFLREDIHPPVCRTGVSVSTRRREMVTWYKGLDEEQKTLQALLQGQVFGLLGINSSQQMRTLMEHPKLKQAASDQIIRNLGIAYGIKGPARIKQKCEEFGVCANAVRDDLQKTLSYPGSSSLEMVNEIRAINEPVDLLLIAFDGKWSAKARWDAKVKLQFMSLAASVDRRQREIGIEDQFKRFVLWIRERVWDPELLADESDGAYLISTHDPDTWACIETKWVKEEEGVDLHLEPFQKKTHLNRRSVKTNAGRKIETYVTTRDKPSSVKVEKMLRKGAEDPATAVDDDTGLLAVFNNTDDVRSFITLLIDRGFKSNYPIAIEDIAYSLNGKDYKGRNGSSRHTKMMKFFVRLANEMRIEFIIHTPESYAESLYMRGVARGEYNINRLIDNGVPDLIFNEKYFPLFDSEEARIQNIRHERANIEESWKR